MDDAESPFAAGETIAIDVDEPDQPKVHARIARRIGKGGQASVYRVNKVRDDRSNVSEGLPATGLILRVETDEPRNGDYRKLSERNRLLVELGDEHDPAADGLVRVRLAGWVTWSGSRNPTTRFAQLLDDGGLALDEQQRLSSVRKPPQPYRSEFTNDEWGAIFAPAARAVSFLHRRGIIHRDINPRNFLAAHPSRVGRLGLDNPAAKRLLSHGMPFVRLSDFGTLVRGVQEEGESRPSFLTTSKWKTTAYTPPEVITSEEPKREADVWMFACTMVILMTGRLPFAGYHANQHDYQGRVLNGDFDTDAFDRLEPRWRELLQQALLPDWRNRATIADLAATCSSISLPSFPKQSTRSSTGSEVASTGASALRQIRLAQPSATPRSPVPGHLDSASHARVEMPTDGFAENPPASFDEEMQLTAEIDAEALRRALSRLDDEHRRVGAEPRKVGDGSRRDPRPTRRAHGAPIPAHLDFIRSLGLRELTDNDEPKAASPAQEAHADDVGALRGDVVFGTNLTTNEVQPATTKPLPRSLARRPGTPLPDHLDFVKSLGLNPRKEDNKLNPRTTEQDDVSTEKVHTARTEPLHRTLPLPVSAERAPHLRSK